MITGLEEDYYCVHNPIPVKVTAPGQANETLTMGLYINGVSQLDMPAVYYTITNDGTNNTYYVDISPWVKQLMENFEEVYTYTTVPVERDQIYVKEIEVRFNKTGYQESATKLFVHCAIDGFDLSYLCCDTCCTKVWKGYPFSTPVSGWLKRVLLIPTEDTFDYDIDVCENIDYNPVFCKGAYLKWLNEKGYYSYWLFPNFSTIERQGDEIYRKPRNIFSNTDTSNEDTAGFTVTETIEVRDKIPSQYWNTVQSLVGSPEVYMLRPSWSMEDEAKPSDWIKIIQNKPKFERETRHKTAEFEMKFDLPKSYTQTRI